MDDLQLLEIILKSNASELCRMEARNVFEHKYIKRIFVMDFQNLESKKMSIDESGSNLF